MKVVLLFHFNCKTFEVPLWFLTVKTEPGIAAACDLDYLSVAMSVIAYMWWRNTLCFDCHRECRCDLISDFSI